MGRRATLLALLLCAAVSLGFTSAGAAQYVPEPPALHYAQLDALASRIAQRPVTVRCPTEEEAAEDQVLSDGAWGYVWFPNDEPLDYTTVVPYVCADALALGTGDEWNQALAVLVITHESYHMRLIRHNDNEAVTECRAIKFFTRSVLFLGGSPELARSLLAEALVIHLKWLPERYQLKSCNLPVPEPR